jgi:hypothetical protein
MKSQTGNDPDQTPIQEAPEQQPQILSGPDVTKAIVEGYGPSGTDQAKEAAAKAITTYLKQSVNVFQCVADYNLLILYDSGSMVKRDADDIYSSVTTFKDKKPLLLVLYSTGGDIGSAYLIGKLCREYSNDKFVIAVPRAAKSAATLLCCAADEIHMGSLSELGPIDPQIEELPALGLKNSIEHIAQLVKKTPESAEMFAKYLHDSLKPVDLGYYERVAESAQQYAVRLLSTHSGNLPREASSIANELVYTYKDHGFVIDKTEAEQIFGSRIIKHNTPAYELGNSLYKELSFLSRFFGFINHYFYFIGTLDSQPKIRKR